jgi:hypothetical protein
MEVKELTRNFEVGTMVRSGGIDPEVGADRMQSGLILC